MSLFAAIVVAVMAFQGQGMNPNISCKHSVHIHTIWIFGACRR